MCVVLETDGEAVYECSNHWNFCLVCCHLHAVWEGKNVYQSYWTFCFLMCTFYVYIILLFSFWIMCFACKSFFLYKTFLFFFFLTIGVCILYVDTCQKSEQYFLCTYKMNQDYFSTPSLHIIISLWRHVSSMPCLVYRQTVDKLFTTSCLCSTDAWFIALMLHRTGIKSKSIHHPGLDLFWMGGMGGGGGLVWICFFGGVFLLFCECVCGPPQKKSLSITLHQYMSFTTIVKVMSWTKGAGVKKASSMSQANIFLPLVGRMNQRSGCEELGFEAKKHYFSTNIDTTNKYLYIFYVFRSTCIFHSVPL